MYVAASFLPSQFPEKAFSTNNISMISIRSYYFKVNTILLTFAIHVYIYQSLNMHFGRISYIPTWLGEGILRKRHFLTLKKNILISFYRICTNFLISSYHDSNFSHKVCLTVVRRSLFLYLILIVYSEIKSFPRKTLEPK